MTEAVSAISFQRRRKLATLPRLHNEEQGDVQDRQRVPGTDAFGESGSDDVQKNQEETNRRFSIYLLIFLPGFLKYIKIHSPPSR